MGNAGFISATVVEGSTRHVSKEGSVSRVLALAFGASKLKAHMFLFGSGCTLISCCNGSSSVYLQIGQYRPEGT